MQIISFFAEPTEYSGQLKFKLDMIFIKNDGTKKNILVSVDPDKMLEINKVFKGFIN